MEIMLEDGNESMLLSRIPETRTSMLLKESLMVLLQTKMLRLLFKRTQEAEQETRGLQV